MNAMIFFFRYSRRVLCGVSLLMLGMMSLGISLLSAQSATSSSVVFRGTALLILPSALQKHIYPYEVPQKFDGQHQIALCGGTRVLLQNGGVYSTALRVALKSLVQKVDIATDVSMQTKLSGKYDMVIEPEITDENYQMVIDKHSGIPNSNINQVGTYYTQPIMHSDDAQEFAIKTRGILTLALRIYTSKRQPLELTGIVVQSASEIVGDCPAVLRALRVTADALSPLIAQAIRERLIHSTELSDLKISQSLPK